MDNIPPREALLREVERLKQELSRREADEKSLRATERLQAEEELRESRERLARILETAPVGITIVNRDGWISFANHAAERILGVTREEILTRSYNAAAWKIATAEGKPFSDQDLPFAMVLRTGKPVFGIEHAIEHANGQRIILSINASPLISRTGEVLSVVASLIDITAQKRMEQELLKAQKLETMGILAGGIAHDFNNLLAGLQGYIDLMRLDFPPEDKVHTRLNAAENAVFHAKELTQRLITFAKGGRPLRTPSDVRSFLVDAAQAALEGFDVKCHLQIASDLWHAEVDEGQIRQVIRNLMLNAAESMPEGGTVTMTAENVTVRSEDHLPVKGGSYIRLSIADKGIGIPKEDLHRIFDPYFSTKGMGVHKGTGLGLSICYSIVNNHEGHIAVESETGKGTIVLVYLPAIADRKPREEPAVEGLLRGRILIMDDEAIIRDVTGEFLRRLGYTVQTASDGSEAVDLFKKEWESGKPFDLVILDLTIRGGMGGARTLEALTLIDPKVKAIIASGYTDDPVILNYPAYGFLEAITKPFKMDRLKEVVAKWL
ncbi:MAG: PAS domain S-box protein [Deltaproteobacteria bacterium]|nr:PAS domain S-box protein [Deltaproteobacteria bacterium]